MITGVHHIALKCASYEEYTAVLALYVGTFGLKTVRSWGEGERSGCMLDAGNTLIELFASGKNVSVDGPVAHIAFRTDNVDECIAKCVELGYNVLSDAKDVTIMCGTPYPIRCGFVKGPAGESIEFFTELN